MSSCRATNAKCRLHGANNDVTVCRAPGNCHDLADHSRAAALLADECEELRSKLEHTQYWYSVRLEHLHHWAHSKLSAELRTEYFSIVANGHEAGSPPTYAQKMNMLSHARDKAEAECSRLQAEVTQLRAERDMPCAHRLEEERLQERVRVLEADYEDGGAATNRELARRLLAAEKRVRVLEAIIATPKVDANDDPSLTCLLCGAENCDAYYVTRGDGQSSASGIHRTCRRAALEGIEVE